MRSCKCKTDAKWVRHPQRVGDLLRTYVRCEKCGQEWTEEVEVIDLVEPVDASEVIDVHTALANENLTLDDLLGPPKEKG